MIVNLIRQNRLYSTTLPDKVKGQFWLCDKDELGHSRELIRMEAEQDKWVLKSNKTAWIIDEEQRRVERVVLKPLSFYSMEIAGVPERVSVFAEPISDDRRRLVKVLVATPCDLTIGRTSRHPISYDNAYISEGDGRGHARLRFDGESWSVVDQSSTNGTYVNGERVGSRQLAFGDLVYMMGLRIVPGKSFFAINNPEGRVRVSGECLRAYEPQQAQPSEEGEEPPAEDFFYRSPRFRRAFERADIQVDPPPQRTKTEQIPLALMLGPSLTMGLASFSTGLLTVSSIAVGGGDIRQALPTLLMSVSMLLGTVLWPILTRRHEKKAGLANEKKRQETYLAYLDRVRDDIRRTCRDQGEILAQNCVTADECVGRILERDRSLWERIIGQEDFLRLRLGRGTLPLNADIRYPEMQFSLESDSLYDAMLSLGREPKLLKDVPVSLSLIEAPVSGIIGPRGPALGLIRSLLIQAAALHSYDELKTVFIVGQEELPEWEFARWLPHSWNNEKSVRYLAAGIDEVKELSGILEKTVLSRRSDVAAADTVHTPHYLIIAASRQLALKCEVLNRLMSCREAIGFSIVTLYDDIRNIPKETTRVIDLNGHEARIYDKEDLSGSAQTFVPEYASLQVVGRAAQALANIPMDISEQKFALPNMLTFLEMFGVSKIEHLNPLTRWKENNPSITLQTPVGVDLYGEPFMLDLHEKVHGPHGLVAGTTGSGKSEFLMTYILSLAVNFHPDEVAFLLIDYKGGGLAGAFENAQAGIRLPHLAGTITNLDGASIKRSMVAIDSEAKRRQEIFNEAKKVTGEGTMDIYKYQRLYREGAVSEPMPHLLIISDEFAELKSQQGEFMEKLISTARIGRSLGIHLILATQKPAGVVDDQIWSNSRFRVCLKVQEKSDSMDMLKRPDAAEISQTGRFFMQVGFNELFAMGQSAWSGADYTPTETVEKKTDLSVRMVDNLGRVIREAKPAQKTDASKKRPKQLVELVRYLSELASEEHIQVRRLWKEPIPPYIYADALEHKYGWRKTAYVLDPVVGEYDDPYNQRQALLTLPLTAGGNAVLYGSAGSGKTTFLMALLYSLIRHYTAEEIHIYALDFGAETLTAFADAPQVGGVLLGTEEEKIASLFNMLVREYDARRSLFSRYGGDLLSYNKNSGKTSPNILVLIHNYAAFTEQFEDYEEAFAMLTRDGVKYGIQFVITANSTMAVRYRIQQNFKQVLTLQLNEETGYSAVLGKTGGLVPSAFKGRGLVRMDRVYEFQTAYPTAQEDALGFLRGLSAALRRESVSRAKPVPVMPARVTVKTVESHIGGLHAVPVGILQESLEPALLDVASRGLLPVLANDFGCLRPFVQAFCRTLSACGAQVICLDAQGILDAEPDAPYAYRADGFDETMKGIFEDFVVRHDSYKRAKRLGEELPTPAFQCVVITGMKKLLDGLSTKGGSDLKEMLKRTDPAFRVCFILVDTAVSLRSLWDQEWYRLHMDGCGGIWIGDGFAGQSVLEAYKKPYESIGDDDGYIVLKGRAARAKLLWTGTAEGEAQLDE